MTPAAMNAFNDARLVSQYGLFGRPVKIEGLEGGLEKPGCHNAADFEEQLVEGGRMFSGELVLRLRMSDWPSVTKVEDFKGKLVELSLKSGWVKFHLKPGKESHLGREWILPLMIVVE